AGELTIVNSGDRNLLGMGSVEQSNTRLLEAMSRLESRINQLEHSSPQPLTLEVPKESSVSQNGNPTNSSSAAPEGNGSRVMSLLGKGQSLLSLDQAEEALTCFDEALQLAPGNTDAFIKKAMALERLRKLQEAIECYDRA